MAEIKILDESISNIIAAGEVVENPASMIKELLENSLDANSTKIDIEVLSGGSYVKISDNGKGMSKEDVLLSIERHATSKISEKDDIFNLTTYGFRGEALASISSVFLSIVSNRLSKPFLLIESTSIIGEFSKTVPAMNSRISSLTSSRYSSSTKSIFVITIM